MSQIVRVTSTGFLTNVPIKLRVLSAQAKAAGNQSYGRVFDGNPASGGVERIPLQCPAGESVQKVYSDLVIDHLYVDLGGNAGVSFVDLEIETA